MNSWGTIDRRILLHFSDAAIETFSQHIQFQDNDNEAGGILLGSVHGPHMLVDQATVPTEYDRRFRCLFERMPVGHETIAINRWTTSKGTIRYLGEWHTHPEDNPSPSNLDRVEWNQLAMKRRDKRPMLAVIVGRKSLYVEYVPSSGPSFLLSPIS